jgi:hypothetical protein
VSRDTVSHLIDYFSILQFLLSNVAEVSKQGTNQLCYQKQVSLYTVNASR